MECLHHVLTVPAKVSKGPDNLKAKRGTTAVLKAEISGEPPPDVAWLKDGDDIEEDDRWNAVLLNSSKKKTFVINCADEGATNFFQGILRYRRHQHDPDHQKRKAVRRREVRGVCGEQPGHGSVLRSGRHPLKSS